MSLRCMRWTWVPMFGRTYGIAGTAEIRAKLMLRPKSQAFKQCQTRKVPSRPAVKLLSLRKLYILMGCFYQPPLWL